jgi:hypothetical protein
MKYSQEQMTAEILAVLTAPRQEEIELDAEIATSPISQEEIQLEAELATYETRRRSPRNRTRHYIGKLRMLSNIRNEVLPELNKRLKAEYEADRGLSRKFEEALPCDYVSLWMQVARMPMEA